MKSLRNIGIVSLIFVLSACSDVEFSNINSGTKVNDLGLTCAGESFSQEVTSETLNKVDILFVTDTSGSFDTERGEVAANILSLVSSLPSNIDFQIAVMLGHSPESSYSGELFQAGSEPVVIRSSDPHTTEQDIEDFLESKLLNVVGDGYSDGGEMGMHSLYTATAPNQLANIRSQDNFFRTDAALAVIFVADENDICARYPAGQPRVPDPDGIEGPAFDTYCGNVEQNSLTNRLREIQDDRPLLVSGVIYTDPDYPQEGENEIGYGYLETALMNGGFLIDMENDDYSLGLERIGDLVTQKLNWILNYSLETSENIDLSTLDVTIDGESAEFNYSPDNNEIQLLDHGEEGSKIQVNYCY